MALRLRARRHQETEGDLARRGVVFVVAVALACGLVSLKMRGAFDDTMPVTARLTSAGGSLRTGVDVKMRGMIVGKVTKVGGGADAVKLGLTIDKRQAPRIPSDVQARVLPASVFGTSYVDLVAPDAGPVGDPLRSGQVIGQDRTQETVELQTALDSIDTLVDALGPGELAQALHTVASALEGRGADLGEAIETFNDYTSRLTPKVPQFRRDLRLLAVNLNAVDHNTPDMLASAENARVTLNRLVSRRKKIQTTLGGAAALLEQTDDFLREHNSDYLRALGLSQTLVGIIYDERFNLRDTLLSTGKLSKTLVTALEDGYGRVEGIVYGAGPGDYTKADCPRYGKLAGANCG